MASAINRPVLSASLLPEGKNRLGSFGVGIVLQCLALIALIVIPLFMPQRFEALQHYWVTPIEAPVIEAWKPQPPPKPPAVKRVVVKKELPKPPEVVPPPKPKIYNPVFTTPVAKPVTPRKIQTPDMTEVAKAFPDQKSLSLGSSAIPTLRKPKEAVQTGGFGDPNGVPANGNTSRNPNIAQLGSFDMPAGPGQGNGTGGAKGARGVVASTGFGNGIAVESSGGRHGTVQQGGFGDEQAVAATPRVRRTAAASNTKPVEILFKPKPVYTDEARAKKVEGDVVLQVIFTASGEIRIQRVLQGLGYGLDESAESAARQIRFHPATQEGQPVDSGLLNVRITFELAY
jgi:TonB family protein